jgi:glutamine amidotransferase
MCRIAAYLGPPVALSALLHEPPHSLEHQSRNAREMNGGSVAGDGWGVGWFTEGDPRPGMIKSLLPIWSDENARTAAHAIVSGSVVGHIRLASPSIETCFTNTPLYPLADHLWTINGELSPWPGPLSLAIRNHLHPDDEAAVRGSTDAELLGALWSTGLRRTRPRDAAAALREALAIARDLAFDHDGTIKVNVIVAGASGFVAVRYAEPGEPNSLYYLTGQDRWHGGSLVASEPLDDGPGWLAVEPSMLVQADGRGLRVEPLDLPAAGRSARRRQSA